MNNVKKNTKNKFYITTPIYYVNAEPHIGHAYTTIIADIIARYYRNMLFIDTFFLTGTDEHGSKIEEASIYNKISTIKHCDLMSKKFIKLWEKLNISYDCFIRTTELRHKILVSRVLQMLYDNKMIYKSEYDGWYCVSCEKFFTIKDLDLKMTNYCDLCKRKLEKIKEENYFFCMSKYQDWLIKYINDNENFILPKERANETLGFLKKPLGDLCISRPKSRVSWGVELPFDKNYTSYVWVDALINYLTGINYNIDNCNKNNSFWPPNVQLMAKDILVAHTVYWPIILKALNLAVPKTIFVHGWWLINSEKMSKSIGNVVDPMCFIDKYGSDAFRYFLVSEMTLGHDSEFSEEIFINRYNVNLANNIGNFVNRIFKFLIKYRNGIIPDNHINDYCEITINFKNSILDVVKKIEFFMNNMILNKYALAIIDIIKIGNEYIEKKSPWLLKDCKNNKELDVVMYSSIELIRIVFSLLYNIMPSKSYFILNVLKVDLKSLHMSKLKKWGIVKSGIKIEYNDSLFPKI